MKLIPRRQGSVPALRPDLESWIDRFFEGSMPDFERLPQAFRGNVLPPVNLAENEKEFIASVELPGLSEEDVEVQVVGNRLVISGERKWEEEKKNGDYYRVESQYGSFRRDIPLPDGLSDKVEQVQATFSKGMLEVRIPKVEPKPAGKIKVRSK